LLTDFLFGDREFYKRLFNIALPIAAQNLVASSLNMVDTIMIGDLGETPIAAVGLANQLFFLFTLFLFGVNSGSAIFTAQFWGKRDIKNIRKVLGIGLGTALAAALVFTVLAVFMPRQVMALYSADPEVIRLGGEYLKIIGFSYIMTAVTFSYAFVLRGTEQAKLPMLLSIVALLSNTVFNYMLIFGHFGFPAMGVRGAAIATVAARLLEVILMLFFVYKRRLVPAAGIREMTAFSWDFVQKFYRTTLPVILNESLWALGTSIYSMVYGRIGTGAVAAVNISGTVEKIAMVLFFGIANASAVMIGNRIGAGEEKKAYEYAKRFLTLGPLLGVVMGLILIVSGRYILMLFNISAEAYNSAGWILIILGCIMPMRIFNLINVVGVLRSGGDTKFSLFLDTFGVWFIGIPFAFAGGILLRLPIYIVILLVSLEEVFKIILGFRRFITGRWVNNLIDRMEDKTAAADAEIALEQV
jgi:putative MATE family efflux protein